MKAIKLYILPVLFSLLSFQILSYSYSGYQYAAQTQIAILSEKISQHQLHKKAQNTESMTTISNLISSLISHHKLPLAVSISQESKSIKIVNMDKSPQGIMMLLSDPKYQSLMAFLSDLPNLPFPMVYDKFCIGPECQGGIEMEVKLQ